MTPLSCFQNRFNVACVLLGSLLLAGIANARPSEDQLEYPKYRGAKALQHEVTTDLMKLPGILGTAIGQDAAGEPTLTVYVDQNGQYKSEILGIFPPRLRGVAVRTELTEKFYAYAFSPGGGGGGTTVSHTAKQTPPIQLGTSGGWRNDLANGSCCGGTLGSLIRVNGVQYILSNYHVLEADIVNGGNGIVATTGSGVIQPGLIDVSCDATKSQSVGTLVLVKSLPNSNVDCAVARVVSGMVNTNGSILEIGILSSNTVAPSLAQLVKKSGRTTNLTRSTVTGLNATISVTYENECVGGTAFTKTFTNQIVIANSRNRFLNGGDSGSLLVEDVTSKPRAVGLLFAGNSSTAIANPITPVLTFLGSKLGGTATMVGN